MANALLPISKRPASWRLALLTTSMMMGLIHGQSAAEKETSARMDRVTEAQQLVLEGDAAYNAGKYDVAVTQFLKARSIIPSAPASADLLEAANERYATAAVQQAAALSRKGDVAAAKQLIEQVLKDMPSHAAALAMQGKLDDPIRTNPALTKEHAKDVDEVRRTLYEADGFFQDGRYDMAKSMYEDVLRIDATNKAARRGLEKVANQKSDYQKAAHDHTRAEMMQEVDKAWEMPLIDEAGPEIMNPEESVGAAKVRFVSEKLRNIIIPMVELEQVSIEEAIDFVRSQARALDTTSLNEVDKGVNIILNLGDGSAEISNKIRALRFDLKLQNVPAEELIKFICDQTRTVYVVDEFAVNIRPIGSDGVELVTRSYKVPPDFLASDNAGAGPAANADNPFDDAPAEGLSARRVTAEEKLKSYGVRFPEGASASFNANSSTLLVRATAADHDLVQQVVDTVAQTEPVQVVLRCTMMKVQNTELNELSFDWIMGEMGVGGRGASGGDALFLGGGTQGTGDAITSSALAPLTSGLRSGNSAISEGSIDALIRNSNAGFSPTPSRAPGALSVLANNLNGSQVAMLMRGFDQKKGVDVMTRPATVARSGQTSKIEVIQELIYPTEYEPPELPNTVGGDQFIDQTTGQVVGQDTPLTPITPAMPTAFEPRNVGTTLEVNPIVSADRRFIELAIKPEIVTFDGFVNYGTPINSGSSSSFNFGGVSASSSSFGQVTENRILQPIFSVIRADTSVTIADGATMVIGGMVEEKVQDVEDKVPVLGDLPFVGRLFQSTARQPIRTTVLIMVQVELQDPSGKPYRTR